LQLVGFEQRRKNSTGHFLDTADVQRSGATRFEEIFRMVPGVRVRPNGTGYMVEVGRGEGQILNPSAANYCGPAYFVDGVYFGLPPLQTATVPIVPAEILAIEVYSNLISAPPQYQRRQATCGVILVWTKRGVPKNRPSH
jgi:outer membrane receptor for Fe3+-dicitrate